MYYVVFTFSHTNLPLNFSMSLANPPMSIKQFKTWTNSQSWNTKKPDLRIVDEDWNCRVRRERERGRRREGEQSLAPRCKSTTNCCLFLSIRHLFFSFHWSSNRVSLLIRDPDLHFRIKILVLVLWFVFYFWGFGLISLVFIWVCLNWCLCLRAIVFHIFTCWFYLLCS